MSIGEVLKILLKNKNITQTELAVKIGKSRTAVSQIVNGVYNPNQETLEKIANALEVPVPIIYFLTIDESDIPEDKKQLYKMLSPSIENFLFDIFSLKK